MIDQFKPSVFKINYKSLILLCSLLFVQLFSLLIFPNNNAVSIIIGILSVLVALFPIAQVILLKKYQFLLSSYVLFSAAPAWFLYLEGISSDGDGFNYLTPNTRIFVYMLSTIFFIFLNLFYLSEPSLTLAVLLIQLILSPGQVEHCLLVQILVLFV